MPDTELPLPDYDHLPQGALMHRIRALSAEELRRLRAYESEHAARVAVLELFDSRLAQLAQGAEPSGGDQEQPPEAPPGPAGGSPVDTATAYDNNQPLRHGVAAQTPNRKTR
jgi:hypothetical protein